jgi:hypothetical protein
MDSVDTGRYENMKWTPHPELWGELAYRCPKLQELIIFMHPRPSVRSPMQDWKELTDWDSLNEIDRLVVGGLMGSFSDTLDEQFSNVRVTWIKARKKRAVEEVA